MMTITALDCNFHTNSLENNSKVTGLSGKKKKRSLQIHESSDESDLEDNQVNNTKKFDAKPEKDAVKVSTKRRSRLDDSLDDSESDVENGKQLANTDQKEVDLNLKSQDSIKESKKRYLRLDDSSDESDVETDRKTSNKNDVDLKRKFQVSDATKKNTGEVLRFGVSSDESDIETEQQNLNEDPIYVTPGDIKNKRRNRVEIDESSEDSDVENETDKLTISSKVSLEHNSSSTHSEETSVSSSSVHKKKEFGDLNKDISTVVKRIIDSSSESDIDGSDDDVLISKASRKVANLNKPGLDCTSSNSGQENSDEESNSSDSSSDEEDDNAPPIRIFRNKNAAAANSRGYDSGNDMSENENSESELPSADVAEPIERPRRRAKQHALPKPLEIKSETQRLIRESRVNLPYHVPEAKKLSQFLKRPISSQQSQHNTNRTTTEAKKVESVDEKMDSGVEIPDLNSDDSNGAKEEEIPASPVVGNPPDRKSQLLVLSGVDSPSLTAISSDRESLFSQAKFIDLDSDEESPQPNKAITSFMERFLNHSKLRNSASKKKVQFNIIKKEERDDGSGIDLVADVVTHSNEDNNKKETVASYKSLREKLTAKMKQRRSEERQKRQELYKLDNEEVGSEHNEEEEEDFSDASSCDSDSEEGEKEEIVAERKTHIIEDDDDEDDGDEAFEPTQLIDPEITNTSSLSKESQHTAKSDTLPSNLVREDSILLFEDTRKASCSGEGSLEDQSFDPLYSSTIPPNKSQHIGDSTQKLHRVSTDEDSYFCSGRSINLSNHSTSRHDYESLFLDSDGFIKESKIEKSMNSLLPPGGEDDNANDCNMSQLLELCSGKFQVSTISPHTSDIDATNDVNGEFIDESFGFQVEADTKKDEKFNDFSDNDRSGDENEEDENGITIIRKKKDVAGRIAKNFLEDEAVLSGDDIGSEDEDDEVEENNYESDENDEQLPKEEVLHQQVNKVHLKQVLDDDQRDIDLLQEAFVTETFDVRRNRKFRWKNIDENLTPDLFHSDDENENPAEDVEEVMGNEESQWRMHRLQREEYINSKTGDGHTENMECAVEEDSQLLRMGRSAIKRSRVLSEINEDSRTNSATKIPPLTRSASLTATKLPKRNSFLARKPEVLSKFANFKQASIIKGAINSDRMVFKVVSPSKKNIKVKRAIKPKEFEVKRPRLDEDSNSIFNLFEM